MTGRLKGTNLKEKNKMTRNSGVRTGKIQGNKKTISSLSLILLLAVSMFMVFAQPTLAQVGVPQPEKTVGFISVAPKLVGVDQEATVNLFIYPIPTNYAYRPYFKGYFGVTVTFVKPDGTKDTFMPVDGTGMFKPGQTQSLGAIYFFYKPDMPGNWSVSFTMPDQNITDSTGTVLMKGCTSGSNYFTVQTDPVLAGLLNGYPWAALPNPNVFWSYPINSNNREWSQIAGQWQSALQNPTYLRWQPYGLGPNTGHIVWKQLFRDGGIIGGDFGSLSYGAQGSVFSSMVILEGKLFLNIPNTAMFECIDLATGKVMYTANGSISGAWHINYGGAIQASYDPTVSLESSYGNSPVPYLFGTSGTTWNLYDPLTGALRRTLTNCSSARPIEYTWLAFGVSSGRLYRWNYSNVPTSGPNANNWGAGIEWTKTLPTPLSANAMSLFGISSDLSTIVCSARMNEFYGFSAVDGHSLWNLTLNYAVTANEAIALSGGEDRFIVLDPTEMAFKCYSMLTGALQWTSTTFSDSVWATTWTVYWSETNDRENYYAQFSDGTMRAYSLKDGHEVWRSKAFPSTEYPNNAVPYVTSLLMVDGKLYGFAGYSSQYKINPISRFAMMICINATNGDTIFTLNGGIRDAAAANGYVIGTGDLDGYLYCLGKGQTQTTVKAPLTTVTAGTSVLIQGSVMDISPASENTPAVSDADMSEWMDYLHMQNATLLNNPPKPEGVTVKVAAVDSNGQVTDLGTTTSDYTGQFALSWKPTTEGLYKILATFEGSNSYYGSYAETALSIDKAPTETPTQPQQTIPDYTMTIIGVGIAIIIAVAIAAVVIIVMVRKK